MTKYSDVKSISFVVVLSLIIVFGNLVAGTSAKAQTATWPQLFVPSCSGGGCLQYTPQCPSNIQYSFPTSNSISIQAKNTTGNTCMAIDANQNCRFLVGDGGVTQISFQYSISSQCYSPASTIAWLSFWMRSQPYSSNSEVDFIESKHGPAVNGLNVNFDANGCQVPIYCAAGSSAQPWQGCPSVTCNTNSNGWSGSITASFSGPSNQVAVSVTNNLNSNVATSTLTGGPTDLSNGDGYFLLMDMNPEGLTINPSCTITVSNLSVQGSFPSTLDNAPNCAGLKSTSS